MNTNETKITDTNEEVVIDASNKSLGRIATEAAEILRGKNSSSFEKNKITGKKVNIINASSIKITTRNKTRQKTYVRYSGYPGGKKEESLDKLSKRLGYKEVIKRAVYGMIPNNKLRPLLMKRLNISE